MPRFFVGADAIIGATATLTGANAEHAHVLRLNSGEQVTLCTADGIDYICAVRSVDRSACILDVLSQCPSASEAAHRIAVCMALAKSDKLEHVIQKATELGAYEILAFASERCVSRPDDAALRKKTERWQKIAESAAEQSGRGRIPEVRVVGFSQMLAEAAKTDLPLFLYEHETAHSLRRAAQATPFTTAAIITGPEGGFTENEVNTAAQAGIQICTLGPRILRCETAPLCALSALMYEAGELG